MRKIKQAFHRGGETNVPPSAAQTTPLPTVPGTGPLVQPTEGPALGVPPGTTGYGTTGYGTSGLSTTSLGTTGYGAQGFSGTTTTIVEQEKTVIEDIRPATAVRETYIEETLPVVTTTAPIVEMREKAPVVQEVIKPGVREEIQPIVHREREQLEIREEIQPIYEKSVRPTLVEERQLAPEIRPELRQGEMPIIAEGPRASTLVEREHVELITKTPIVEEVVHKKIIEEVQPVIYRETIAPKVIHEVQPIYEKIIEAPVVTYQTLPARYTSGVSQTVSPSLVEQTTVTTTTVEKEFIPQTTSNLSRTPTLGTATAPLGQNVPLGGTTAPLGPPGVRTNVLPGQPGYMEGFSEGFREGMKLEDQARLQPGTFQYK